MNTELQPFIARIADGGTLSADEAEQAFDIIMSGKASDGQIGGFLMALRMRGETTEEVTGAARVMRAKATPVTARDDAIDTCGTGGDAKGTLNISTAAALVVAGCGVPVAKHGNRSLSSKSGSSQVLEALGVNIETPTAVIEQAIDQARIGFMMAPRHHGAMRHVGPVRVELGTRTIFNLLGPLANPASTKRQLIGVFSRDWVEPIANVLNSLGTERAWVVHGSDGLDELTLTGTSFVAELKDGKVTTREIDPRDYGLDLCAAEELLGGDPAENADAIRKLLDGEPSAYRDVVLLNAAAALVVAGNAETMENAVSLARASVDSGAAKRALEQLVAITNAKADG